MNVLLAEDNPVNQEVAAGLLEILDCTVTIVDDGQQAIDAVNTGKFDLVLMDCQMPVMDGLDATRAIRNVTAGDPRLPIVALTANDHEDIRAACRAAGMDDFLSKPFTREQLQAALQRWRPSVPSGPAVITESKESSLDPAPIEMLRALDPNGERNLINRTITKFIDYSDELVTSLIQAVGENDVKEASRITHSLKSSSANLGAVDLSRHCAELEKLAGNGSLPTDIDQKLADLQAVHRTAKQDLLELMKT